MKLTQGTGMGTCRWNILFISCLSFSKLFQIAKQYSSLPYQIFYAHATLLYAYLFYALISLFIYFSIVVVSFNKYFNHTFFDPLCLSCILSFMYVVYLTLFMLLFYFKFLYFMCIFD